MKRLLGFMVVVLGWVTVTGACAATGPGSSIETVLSDTEIAYLVFMREEEKLARDTYVTLAAE